MAIFSGLSAIVGGLLGGTFLSGLGGTLLKIAVGIGLNLLASSLAGKPEPRTVEFAIQGQIQTGGDVARSFPIGWTATAGSLVYANAWGTDAKTPNAYFTQVIALSDLPIGGLEAVWVNGVKVTLDSTPHASRGYPVLEYRQEGKDHLWVKFHDGTQTSADSFLTNSVSTSANPYGSNRVGRGVAYVVCTARINEELFTGFPQYRFEVNGVKLYDPSKDSTVGGSGSQRWSSPSTWGGDGDHLPAVQLYNILRGISYGGQWFYGLQSMSAARLPVDDWIARINQCREEVAEQPRYRCGGEIAVSARVTDAVTTILTSCQGRLSEAGGVYKLRIGVSDASVASIADSVILSTEEQTFSPFFGLADTINGISATYPSPAEGWNRKAAPPRYSAQAETEDGNRRLMADVPLDFVPYKVQVQRLMKAALAEARRARRHTFVLPPAYWTLEPGDFIRWTSVRNGYDNKKFRVDGIVDRPNLDVVVDVTEVDPSDYDWSQSTDFRVEPDGLLYRTRPDPQPIIDWHAEATAIADNQGRGRRPAILLSWDGDVDDVSGVRFEVRLASTSTVVYRGRTDAYDAGGIIISQALLPRTDYVVRGRYIPRSDRGTLWSGWLPVTTLDIKLGDEDVYLPGMLADIRNFIADAEEWIEDGVRDLINDATAAAYLVLEQDLRNYDDKQDSTQEIKSTTGRITAAYRNEILAATGPNSALAQRIETVEVEIPTLAKASVVNAVTARVTAAEGQIDSIAGTLTLIQNEVAGKASVTALNALTTRVTASEGKITAYGQSLTSINAALGTKASAQSVSLLTARVEDNEGEITSVANALMSVSAAASGSDVATARFRMTASAGPTGYASRIGMQARATGRDGWRGAALFLDVPNNPSQPTRVVINAEQFVVTNGSAVKNPFIFQDGEARLNVAHIGTVRAGRLLSLNSKVDFNLNAGTLEFFS